MEPAFRWGAVTVTVALALVKLTLLATGSVHNPGGDASVRVIVALRAASSPLEFVQRDMWIINWPPGQFMVLGPIFWIADLLNPGPVSYQSLAAGSAAVVFSIGLIFLYGLVVFIVDRGNPGGGLSIRARGTNAAMAGFVAVVAFGSAALPSRLSITAQSESFALPIVIVAAYLTVRYFRRLGSETTHTDLVWLCVAWLAASLMRTSVLFLAAWLVIPMVYSRRFRHALVFSVVVPSFTILKAWVGSRNGSFQYLDYAAAHAVPGGLEPVLTFFRILTPRFNSWLHPLVWLVASVGSIGIAIARKRPPAGLLFALAYLVSYLAVVGLGLWPPIDRYLYPVALFLCVALGEVVGEAWNRSAAVHPSPKPTSWIVASVVLATVVAIGVMRVTESD